MKRHDSDDSPVVAKLERFELLKKRYINVHIIIPLILELRKKRFIGDDLCGPHSGEFFCMVHNILQSINLRLINSGVPDQFWNSKYTNNLSLGRPIMRSPQLILIPKLGEKV